jgi:xanthine dehydrogenase YagS FAD-binding subunit
MSACAKRLTALGYTRAADLASALSLGSAPGAEYVAGGTDLVALIKDGQRAPSRLVDITALPLRGVAANGAGVRIGALERMQDVADHPLIRGHYPVVAEALRASASMQVRNMATVGGNLLQRTRCSYFRDAMFPCNKRAPGSGCPAIAGEHRAHAVFGGSDHCVAAHASDLAVALVALDAALELHGPAGPRRVPLREFYRLPAETPERETVLGRGELIVAVDVPGGPHTVRSHFLKVRDRASFEFALVSAAVALHIAGGVVRTARVAAGGVGTVPWHLPAVEAALEAAPATAATFRAAASLAVLGARPLPDNAFKVTLCTRALVRALETAATMEARE